MTLSNRLIGLALALLVLGTAVAACSREGGYATTEVANEANPAHKESDRSYVLKIGSWGPTETTAGSIFNAQPDGSAALWLQVNQSLDGSDAVVTMDGKSLHSAISGELITASVPEKFYATSGVHTLRVMVTRDATSLQSNDVSFVVH